MDIAQLLANEELRRHEFPVTRDRIFLGHAGDSPLPRRVADAVAEYAHAATLGDQESVVYPAILDAGRKVASELLHCGTDEVAFVGPTSLALSFFASGLKFRRSDNILVYFDDYPSNVYPWMALAEQGVQVRLMNTRGLGLIRPQDVMGQVDENTRLVALATCHFISGYRIDYAKIGERLRERGILFCLDAIQTVGAFPMDVQHVDMLAADAHKWLLGPCGAGIMYVRKSVQDNINPPIYGWNNVNCPNFVAQEQLQWCNGAHKYEAGTYNLLGLVGLIEGMKLLLETGVDKIGAELLRKRAWFVPALQEKGYTVCHADAPPTNASGIISVQRPGKDLEALHRELAAKGVVTSLRTTREGERFIRLSPHFYNTDEELRRVLELL